VSGSSEHGDGHSGALCSAVNSALPPTNSPPITHCGLSVMAMTNFACPAKNRTRVFPPVSGYWHQPSSLRGLPVVCAMRSDLSSDGNQCHS